MRRAAIVFLGGGLGASLRGLLLAWLSAYGVVPVLLANLLGSFALGVVFVLADEAGLLRPETRLFIAVGVLGGFTTFSTFAWGADLLLAQGLDLSALAYVVGSVLGGMSAVYGGLIAGRALVSFLERAALALLGRLSRRPGRHNRGPKRDLDSIEAEDRTAQASQEGMNA